MESIDEFLERYEREHLIIRINGEPKGKGRPRFTKAGRAFTPKLPGITKMRLRPPP